MYGYGVVTVRSACFGTAIINQLASLSTWELPLNASLPQHTNTKENVGIVNALWWCTTWRGEDWLETTECCAVLYCKQSIPSLLKNVHHAPKLPISRVTVVNAVELQQSRCTLRLTSENSRQDKQVAQYQNSHHITHTCIFICSLFQHKHSLMYYIWKVIPPHALYPAPVSTEGKHTGLSRGDTINKLLTETGQHYISFKWLAAWVCPLHTTAFRVQVFSTSSLECIYIFSQLVWKTWIWTQGQSQFGNTFSIDVLLKIKQDFLFSFL